MSHSTMTHLLTEKNLQPELKKLLLLPNSTIITHFKSKGSNAKKLTRTQQENIKINREYETNITSIEQKDNKSYLLSPQETK